MVDKIRVYLLDDHDVVREGLRFLLESTDDIHVAGESGLVAGGAHLGRRRGGRAAA